MTRRRSIAVAAAALAAGGCGDGSTASVADAGSVEDAAVLQDATLDAGPCSNAERDQRFTNAAAALIVPRRSFLDIDLLGASLQGTTLPEVEEALCPGDAQGDLFGDGTRVMTWGPNAEIWASYDPTTFAIRAFVSHGIGKLLAVHSADGAHAYSIQLLRPITRDGAPLTLDWSGPDADAELDELHRALLATFVPSAPQPPMGTLCIATGDCKRTTFGDVGMLSFSKVGVAFGVANVDAGQPAASIFSTVTVKAPPYP